MTATAALRGSSDEGSKDVLVKVCGLTDPAAVDTALQAGADMIGLVFFPPSPRHLSFDVGASLAERARGKVEIVALTVDADADTLDAIAAVVRPTLLQLHGKESPDTVAATRARLGLPVMKAIGVAEHADLAAIDGYRAVADHILLDAKPPKDATRPGGNGASFDWSLLATLDRNLPFMLSGGLTPETVATAIRAVRPRAVDVSSGVEASPGRKDPALIRAFIEAVRTSAEPAEARAAAW